MHKVYEKHDKFYLHVLKSLIIFYSREVHTLKFTVYFL